LHQLHQLAVHVTFHLPSNTATQCREREGDYLLNLKIDMKWRLSFRTRQRRKVNEHFGSFIVAVLVFSLLLLVTVSGTSADATTTTTPRRIGDATGIGSVANGIARCSITVTGDDSYLSSSFCLCRVLLGVSQPSSVFLPLPPRGGGQRPPPPPPPDDNKDSNDPSKRPKRRPNSKASSSSSSSSLLSRLAQQSAKLSSQALSATARGSGQVAYALLRPKHVEYAELVGLWRLDQWIEDDDNNNNENHHHHYDETRTLELTEQCTVLFSRPQSSSSTSSTTSSTATTRDSAPKQKQQHRHGVPLEFKPAHWPSLATLSFYDHTTRLYYKCTVQRKMADPKVLKLRGKIYKMQRRRPGGLGVFWQKSKKQNEHVVTLADIQKKGLIPIGTFVGRRRMKLLLTDNDDDQEEQDESDWESDDDADYDDDIGNESSIHNDERLYSESWDVDGDDDEKKETGTDEYCNVEEEEDYSDR
jgi:hypothetical protein